ncbi:MAG: c-type cytochrome [Gammaproteobacteria bacterium]
MMRSISAVVLGLVLLVPCLVSAEPSSEVTFDAPTRALLAAANPANGEKLADKCHKCHGDAGVSDDPGDANIAGMRASYIYKQLQDFHTGKRIDRGMNRQMKGLDEQTMADLAVWYASLPPAQPAGGTADPTAIQLVFFGDPTRDLKACASCHGRDGRGGQYDHPAIAGQNHDYLVQTLTDFKEGSRENDIYARMRLIARALTDEEINALAAYYAAPVTDGSEQ